MVRQAIFQVHWFLGVTAGLVLAVMGFTGALMAFEPQIVAALTAQTHRSASPVTPLGPDALVGRILDQRPGAEIQRLIVGQDSALPYSVRLLGADGREDSLVDPATGALLGAAPGSETFATIRRVHRWLALPDNGEGWGRRITGVAALSLIFFAVSGLYLRWPRRPLDWRNWLVLDLRRTGRNLYRTLHAVIGGWALVFYLVSASTGLWWSYGWYQDGVRQLLTGEAPTAERPAPSGEKADKPPLASIDRAWAAVRVVASPYDQVTINPSRGDKPVKFSVLPQGARHDRMTDVYAVRPGDGTIVERDLYASRPMGEVIVGSVLPIHRGTFFGVPGQIMMMISSISLPLFAVTGLLLYFGRRRRKAELRRAEAETGEATGGQADERLLVAYAS